MTRYIAAYDTESPDCLAGVRRIVAVHEKHEMPATFFIVARLLEDQREEYVALLRDHPLFEIACHSYSHMPLVDAPRFAKAGPLEQFPREIVESKAIIEDTFGCAVTGFRPPCSGPEGLAVAPEALRLLDGAGYEYVSSFAWGPDCSLPAPLVRPFTYAEQGYPGLWEFPACGWHENLLKGHNNIGAILLCLFPPDMPETIPDHYVTTPEEEFQVNCRPFLNRAVKDDMPHVSFIWHPWSLHRLDPDMRMVDITLGYVRELDLPVGTFATLLESLQDGRKSPSSRNGAETAESVELKNPPE